ncbi:hypothetical protein [Billgrantia bachuensis]|uniref:Uncharacterized protein n=1 Tax=Billgrantia bachuensis TaxID=2717286 RepID=A0ABX0PQ30_9GAMM|nr:hypothetical protein [Halomonas bachuensis]NIC05223.1 hypothetical protein [Halomonas bachuensis]
MRYHCHFEIDYLLGRSDRQLGEMLIQPKDGTHLRTALCEMKQDGQQFLVVGECNNKRPDGSCAGHAQENEDA